MKSTFQSRLWVVSVLLLLTHQFLQKKLQISIPFLDNWLDPFLSMPILLGLILAERRWFFKNKKVYSFSILEVVIAVLFFSFVFEFIFPKWDNGFTFDWWDFVGYGLGGLVFYFFQNPK